MSGPARFKLARRSWPTPQDYNLAIQNPRFCFKDPELQAGTAAVNRLGLPIAVSGGFASVYRVRSGNRDWAVRCFDREIPDTRERYDAISEHLGRVHLPYLVPFDYLPKGIRVNGAWYPILKMAWVQGVQLDEYIRDHLGDVAALRRLAERWLEMVRSLEAAQIAHGDLQHGNVLIVGDELRLVDYDGMIVPRLNGRSSHELGHRNYQHPARTQHDVGFALDRFSAWVIYTSLLALAADPSLWTAMQAGDDCLLFRRADFENPGLSPVFTALGRSPDPEVRAATAQLRLALDLGPLRSPVLAPPVTVGNRRSLPAFVAVPWLAIPALLGRPFLGFAMLAFATPLAPQPLPLPFRSEASEAAWYRDYLPATPPSVQPPFARARLIPRISLAVSCLIVLTIIILASIVTLPLTLHSLGLTFGLLLAANLAALLVSYVRDQAVVERRALRRDRRLSRWDEAETERPLQKLNHDLAAMEEKAKRRQERLVARRRDLERLERAERAAVDAWLQARVADHARALADLDAAVRADLVALASEPPDLAAPLRDAVVARHLRSRRSLTERRTRLEQTAAERRAAIGDRYARRLEKLDERIVGELNHLAAQRQPIERQIVDLEKLLKKIRADIHEAERALQLYDGFDLVSYIRLVYWLDR